MCRCATWAVALEPANQNELLNDDEEHWIGEHWRGPHGALSSNDISGFPKSQI
jgi:hypothetical protein